MSPTRSLPLVALALAVAVIVVHARVVIGGKTWDDVPYHTEIAPPRLAAAELVVHGSLPAWWDGTGLGVPLAAEPSHGAMYPPLWLAPTPRSLDLAMLLHLAWAALGVAVWARRRTPPATTGVSDPSALVAGLLVATTGLLASTALRGALPALAHLPWIGVTAMWLASAAGRYDRVRREERTARDDDAASARAGKRPARDDKGDEATGTAASHDDKPGARGEGAAASGEDPSSAGAGATTWPHDTVTAAREDQPSAGIVTTAPATRPHDTVAAARTDLLRAVAAPAARPHDTMAAARADLLRATAALGALIGLVGLTGQLAVLVDALVLAGVLAGRRSSWRVLAIAIGAGLAIGAAQWIPAMLQLPLGAGVEIHGLPLSRLIELIVPGSFGSSDPDRAVAALAGGTPWAPSLFVGAPLLALAAVRTPSSRVLAVLGVFSVLALVVGRGGWPAWLGAPELHLAALVLVLGAHAGAGIDALGAGQRRAVLALVVAAGCSAIAVGALGALRAKHPDAAPAIDRALLDGGLGVLCMAIVIALSWRTPGRAMPIVLALLVLPGVGASTATAPVIARSIVDQPPLWARSADEVPRPARVFRPSFMHEHVESVEDAISTLAGDSPWRWRLAAARTADPARLPAHDRVWLAAAGEGGALLDRFGIALAILPATVVAPRKVTELARRGPWALVVIPVAPVASVLRGWQRAIDPTDATALLFAAGGGTHVLRGTVVLGGAGDARPDKGPPLPCTIQSWTAGDIALHCAPDLDGYAVISSTPSPGWSVTVDSESRDWLPADVLRRAVKIDAGFHTIQWSYSTPGGLAGLIIALLGVLAIAALLVMSRARGRALSPREGPGARAKVEEPPPLSE